MAANKDEAPVIQPENDPYEFQWPDDAKDLRAAEREKARKKADITPAPRWLTAWALGVGVQLAFFGIIAVVAGSIALLVQLTFPTVLVATVGALPVGLVLERITRGWRPGYGEATFLGAGMLIGFTWTYLAIGASPDLFVSNTESLASTRQVASIFMLTSVGSAFFVARAATDAVRYKPKTVYVITVVVALLTAWSAVLWATDLAGSVG